MGIGNGIAATYKAWSSIKGVDFGAQTYKTHPSPTNQRVHVAPSFVYKL